MSEGKRVHIIQCLCPMRHAIMGVAYDPADLDGETVMTGFKEIVRAAVEKKAINAWCRLCKSRDWHYEDAATIFTTIEEARPWLEATEEAQAVSANILAPNNN